MEDILTLTQDEQDELSNLAFRVVADLPMNSEQFNRYRALKTRRDHPLILQEAAKRAVEEQEVGE